MYKSKTVHEQLNQDNQSIKYYELLAFYDCLSSMAYALVLRNNGSMDDTDFARLSHSYKEIILLTNHGEFLGGKQDVCSAVDDYLTKKMPVLAPIFLGKRSKEQRICLDIDLIMREQCLHTVHILLNISKALCAIKTPATLQVWDQVLDLSFLKVVDELKNNYLLLDRFPPGISFPGVTAHEEKQLAILLSLHHGTKDLPPEIFTNGKTQFYFIHHLLQVVNALSKLSTELPLLALNPEAVAGLSSADIFFNRQIETITDSTIAILAACEKGPSSFEATIAPTMTAMIATNIVLSYAQNLVSQLPRNKRGERAASESIRKKLTEDSRWLTYRQRNLDHAKQSL